MRTVFRAAVALAVLIAAANASAKDAARTASPTAASLPPAHAARPRLLFFMNPNGMPCQMQDRVLRDMGAELSGKAEVVYVKTTESADIAQFSRYGIRSLPTLLVTDATGREIRRATPGIQSAEQVRQLLGR